MAILTNTSIFINGTELPFFDSCKLSQEIGNHHYMEIMCRLELIQKFCGDHGQDIEELLGAVLIIETKSYHKFDFYGNIKFKGVITGLQFKNGIYTGDGNYLAIQVNSPTIIADDGPNYGSYLDVSFVDIIAQNFTNYDSSKLSINTKNSKLRNPFPYTVQYDESSFEFAQRLSARYGEWMYFDGEALVFGLADAKEIELILGRDLLEFNSSLQPLPQNFDYYTNDYLSDKIHQKSTTSFNHSQQGQLGVINNLSKNLYTRSTQVWVNISDDSNAKNRLDEKVLLQQNRLQTSQLLISGKSDNPGVALASVIKINGQTYRVTKVKHAFSNNGDQYENHFEATSTVIDAYPKTDINAFPKAPSQTAKVIENHDPEGLGRIKVQLRWQQNDSINTPWIRNISPSASQGQGMYFIPEIDDEVIVSFEGDNAECPYVIGCVYHAKATPPSGSSNTKNHIKMIQSRSGAQIMMNDQNGSITIKDKSGSAIILDGSGHINIRATKSINISAKDDFNVKSEKNTNLIVEKDLSVATEGNSKIDTGAKLSINTTAKTEISDSANIEISAPSVNVKGDANLKLEGTMVDVDGKAMTNVKGGIVNLN